MTEVLVPQDIEAALVSHLGIQLGCLVATRVPNPRPAKHVRVRRTGGRRVSLVLDNPTVLVECWAETESAAHDLAGLAGGALAASPGTWIADGVWLNAADVSSPVNYEDPSTRMPRYQFTASLWLRLKVSRSVTG